MGYYCKHGRGRDDNEGCDERCEPVQKLWDETPEKEKAMVGGQMKFVVNGQLVSPFYVVGRKPAPKGGPYPWCYRPEECSKSGRCEAKINCGD